MVGRPSISSVGRRAGGVRREGRNHFLEFSLIGGLVRRDEQLNLFFESTLVSLVSQRLIFLDLGLQRSHLLSLFRSRQLVVAVDLHDRLVGFQYTNRQQLIVVRGMER